MLEVSYAKGKQTQPTFALHSSKCECVSLSLCVLVSIFCQATIFT